MGVVSCILPGPILVKSENRSLTCPRMSRGNKLPIILMISLWTLQFCVTEVAGKALPFTAATSPPAPPSPHNKSAPAAGLQFPPVPAPSPIGEAPQQSDPPTQSEAAGGQLVQFQQVLSSLRVNNSTTGAQYVSDYLFLLPLGSTLFVPTNAAFHGVLNDDHDGASQRTMGPVLAYHTVSQQLNYQQIALLPIGTRLATLIANNNTIEITSVASDDLRVDDVRVVQRDVCISDGLALEISCHGVDGILNMTEWGQTSLAPAAPRLAPVASPAESPAVESPSVSTLVPPPA